MSLIFVLGNIGGALAAAVLPEAVIGVGGATAGAGTAALGGTGAALAGSAAPATAGLFGGTSLAAATGAPTGIAATAGEIAQNAAGIAATNADKAALTSQATSGLATNASAASPATLAPGASTSTASALPTTGSSILDSTIVGGGLTGAQKTAEAIQTGNAVEAQNKGYEQLKGRQGQELSNVRKQQNLDESGLAGGKPLGAAHGGSINLQSGQFVIPADIVSDLGNGDTKAGMEFLKQFFETGGHA